ncbi:hypothetical protein M427DRAFT_136955 [Gonapodya prolifera JEL478]|uniref:Uncharacterized protein n=1 Tax=Gonapodya prolifera (strain JEL478) TaxID=1344416 RepID=A0A139A7Z9_GONPJ|nr:hypothetical protein M427DRAFT_136955 [Gonapodya prolifera JEL478]|eukprot:KXS12808.1 hypothetical protein M427DRAFT_136955 [Gonapodya prolifera JEL478]
MANGEHPNKRLIQAIEDGKIDLIQRALDDGADPNARKRVHLAIPVTVDTVVLKKGGLFSKKKQEEILETYQDSHSAESALGIAVLSGRPDVVQLLLDAGANPNVHVEWRIAGFGGVWTRDRWDRERWALRVDFPSPLALALANGRVLKINKRGGEIKLVNPLSMSQVSDMMELRSSIDVVQALLDSGAMITSTMLDSAKGIKDKAFIQAIEAAMAARGANPGGTPALPRPLATTAIAKSGPASLASSTTLASRDVPGSPAVPSRSDTARSHKSVQELEAERDDMEAQNTELSTRNSDLQLQNRRLAAQNVQLQARVAELEAQLAQARIGGGGGMGMSMAPSTPVSPSPMSTMSGFGMPMSPSMPINPVAGAGMGMSMSPSTPVGFGSPNPFSSNTSTPMPLKQVLYAIADYIPTSPDEIPLIRGHSLFGNLKYADGWISGINTTTGATGLFPMTHVSTTSPSGHPPFPPPIVPQRTSSITLYNGNPFSSHYRPSTPSTIGSDMGRPTTPFDLPSTGSVSLGALALTRTWSSPTGGFSSMSSSYDGGVPKPFASGPGQSGSRSSWAAGDGFEDAFGQLARRAVMT